MTLSQPPAPFAARSLGIALAVGLALAIATMSGDLLRTYLSVEPIKSVPYLRSALTSLADIFVMGALIAVAAARAPAGLFSIAGLDRPIAKPILWALAVLGPSALLSFFVAPLGEFKAADVAWLSIGGPLTEEIVFRGLAIGALMQLAGWRFLPAALLPAVFFGVAHAAQGEALMEIVGVVAITGLGGLLFGWLFVRWDFNLWPPILLHIGMNAVWLVFDLGENAIGGWYGNAQRLLVVALAIGLTLVFVPRKKP